MRKRVFILAVQAFLLFTLLVGTTNAWFIDETNPESVQASTARIKAELDFNLKHKENENIIFAGIPGESMIISDMNKLIDKDSTKDYIFKLSYVLEDQEEVTEKLFLSGEKNGFKESYDSSSKTLTVYGLYKVSYADTIELPELAAEFKVLKNPAQGKGFSVEANLEYCQNTKEAAMDFFSLNEAEFTELINVIGGGSNE